MSSKYKVIDTNSQYYGRVATSLDRQTIEKTIGNTLGRNDSWYDYWDVLLDFEYSGVGFKLEELEELNEGTS